MVSLLVVAGMAVFAGEASYVGAAACTKCHAQESRQWSSSRHSKMVQPATTKSVQGDFSRTRITLHGDPYLLREAGGVFYITESYLTGKPQEHRIDYTLGNRRIQHYLTTLADGRIILLQPSWDILRKGWFHNLDVADPENVPGVQVQLWNKSCFSCHVSQQEKNFDLAKASYDTKWLDFGTNCERCHGPGSAHVTDRLRTSIVLQTRLEPERNTMVCAQCHSFRDIFVRGYSAGANYFDYFMPILDYGLSDDADRNYWADGRPRRFSNDAFGFWQSECFLKGKATCVSCHVNAHETEIERNPQLRPDANSLCVRCHAAEGKAGAGHTHHAAASTGSSCVECHMPRTVLSIKAAIRDHAMSVPVAENTVKHGIPNACNLCHKDRDTTWTLEKMNTWYGKGSRGKWIRRADAFALAREGDAQAIPGLLAILTEQSEGPLARANAAGYLGSRFASDARVSPALLWALTDSHPLIRATAALRMDAGKGDRAAAIKALRAALNDSSPAVRLSAAVTLVSVGVKQLPGIDGGNLESAKILFRDRAAHNSDDAAQQLAAGRFYYLTGDFAAAVEAFRGSLKLDPGAGAEYLLAVAYAGEREFVKAREVLETIPPTDAQYEKAQRLLKAIAAEQAK